MLTRRSFTNACAAAPLLGLIPEAGKSYPSKRVKFVLRTGLIWSRGRQLRDGTWSLAVGLYDCRRRGDGKVRYRHLQPSDYFASMLRQQGFVVKRSSVQPVLLATSLTLHHGPVGFDRFLEELAPVNNQRKLYVDATPIGWDELPLPVERHLHVEVQ